MKKVLALILFLFTVYIVFPQDTTQLVPSEKNPKIRISGFGGVLSETSILRKHLAESLGAGGALMINNYFFIGGYAMGMASNQYIDDLVMPTPDSMYYNGTSLRINYSHAGFWIGGIFFHEKTVHFGVSTRLGWGHIYLTDKYNTSYIYDENSKLNYTNDKVFVISPQVELEIKITPWLKTNIGLGYNFVTGVNFDRFKQSNFNAPQLTIGIYFGGFSDKDDDENLPDDEVPDEN